MVSVQVVYPDRVDLDDQAMQHFCLYIIEAKNLTVEVDAKYIKGMLNNSDL